MIDNQKFVKDFLNNYSLNAKELDGREVDEIYEAFTQVLPAGISISKRMFLKHIRLLLPLDAKPGYKYIDTGKYQTITKFVKTEKPKTLASVGFTDHSTSHLARFKLDGAIEVQIDKQQGLTMIRTSGFVVTSEILEGLLMEVRKYEQKD